MSATPRTDAHGVAMESEDFDVELAKTYTLACTLEREIAELNQRLIERRESMMSRIIQLQTDLSKAKATIEQGLNRAEAVDVAPWIVVPSRSAMLEGLKSELIKAAFPSA